MTIVCCPCSKEKALDDGSIPARKRYIGSHIGVVEKMASRKGGGEFFLLSGLFGLIPAEHPIPNYDHLLEDGANEGLVRTVCQQLKVVKPSCVIFYTKSKPSWHPYTDLLMRAALEADVELHIHKLLGDA